MPTQVTPYPPVAPVVAGENITVSLFLASPPRIQRAVEALTNERFIADVIFGMGPTAEGGAVIHDQVVESNLYTERDVEEISPGADFPLLTSTEPTPLVAVARKYGGEIFLTDEQIRRNNRAVLTRETTKLRNTIVRKVDTVAIAALEAAPIQTSGGSGDWSTAATDIIADLVTASGAISSLDMGYIADTVLINPLQEQDLLKDKDIRDALPRERDNSIIRTGNLGRLMGLDFIVSNRVTAGTAYVLQRKIIGGISDEVPIYARPIADERRERVYIHGARVVVPYVTDPKAIFKLTGI